jgi:peptidoglycan DL-endopeptidase CwlO
MAAPQQPLTPPNTSRAETGAAQRGVLDQRIRAIRRRIVAASLVGTAAFSLLAAYETRGTVTAAPATPAVAIEQSTTAGQSTSQSFFASQSSGVTLGTATATTATTPATTTASATTTAATTAASTSTTTTQQSTTTAQATSQTTTSASSPAHASGRTKSSTS